MKLTDLQDIIHKQNVDLEDFDLGTPRELLEKLPIIHSHALIITGIRRCGKSVLLHQFIKDEIEDVFYFNCADIRLYNFSTSDFTLLDKIYEDSGKNILFLDEIQLIEGWELYVRQKLDQSKRILITGSNARMLSVELGTNLTGRHISKELFPFNYREYCLFLSSEYNHESYMSYLEDGGFPEFLKTGNDEVLSFLIEDIIHRDIAARHGIRDVAALKRLCIYLLSNIAKPFSPSKLTGVIDVKSPSTVLEYLTHFESSYLLNTIPRFAWSVKGQLLSEKKIYAIDNGLIKVTSLSASRDVGRKFENAIYWAIRQKTRHIWYFSDGHSQCDFIYKIDETYAAVQVCFQLNDDNQEREIKGLLSALHFFELSHGLIITIEQKDQIISHGCTIDVVAAYEFEVKSI